MSERDSRTCCPVGPVGWIFLITVALTAAYACQTRRKTSEGDPQVFTANMPESAAEMATFLRDKLAEVRIVSTRADGQIDRSFIMTIRDSDEDTLRRLPRVSDRIEQWRGTVLCEWLVDWQPAELFLEEWKEYGFARQPFVFFGDKALLAQIKQTLPAGEASTANPASSHKSR